MIIHFYHIHVHVVAFRIRYPTIYKLIRLIQQIHIIIIIIKGLQSVLGIYVREWQCASPLGPLALPFYLETFFFYMHTRFFNRTVCGGIYWFSVMRMATFRFLLRSKPFQFVVNNCGPIHLNFLWFAAFCNIDKWGWNQTICILTYTLGKNAN